MALTLARALAVVFLPPLLLTCAIHSFQQPSFRSNTLAVRVDVLVTEGHKPVAGLTARDFDVRDNGVAQSIELVDTADLPVNVVLALDTSGSMTGSRHADLVAASEAMLGGLLPVDRAALTTFSHAVMPRIPLTGDLDAVREALRSFTPSGLTAVMDGVYVALTTTLAQSGRSLVVVCTDGSDVSSWLRPDDVIESAKRSNAVIYAVTSADARRVASLEELTELTGGGTIRVAKSTDLRGAFDRILREFRSRYILSYTPTGVPLGGWHRLDVRLKRRGLTLKARPGYIGVEPDR